MADRPLPLAIGINGGGTHTSLALADPLLRVIARAEVGPSNPNYIGYEAAHDTIQAGIQELLRGVDPDRVMGIGAGLSGVDRPGDSEIFVKLFSSLYPSKTIVIDNDALSALVAGVGRKFGIVTISGTGMIALGVNNRGERARSGGWGHYMDLGSGYWIARAALNAAGAAHDGAAPATAITDAILNDLGLKDFTEAITWAYDPERRVDQIAALARHVVILAEQGDLAAIRIISEAAHHLAASTNNTARKLGFEQAQEPFPVLLSGSIFKYSSLLRSLFEEYVSARFPRAVILNREHDAPLGAAMMAFSALGIHTPAESERFAVTSSLRGTERRHPLTLNIGSRPTLDFLTAMNIEDGRIAAVIGERLPQIGALVDDAAPRFEAGGRLILIGAGTSGRLAVLDAAECLPTFGTDRVIGIIAGGEQAVFRSLEGAEDSDSAGAAAVMVHAVNAQDTVIGVAASGGTPYVIGALKEATSRGALTGCIVNNVDTPIVALVTHPIVLPTGAEALTGSTRLKAGTAQKITLNLISTGIMLRAGRTFHNLMTDMQAGNLKLRGRAVRIVADAAGISETEASALLDQCGGEMKTAIAAARLKLSPEAARAKLAQVGGNLGKVIG
ncbi:MAG: N-acetylmuramic acid 6-phosphate etherase [Anaerolinea sp.]|nr:N-acetylmuramic acid 6-phosphate etherase [Anaerolinea sp.]